MTEQEKAKWYPVLEAAKGNDMWRAITELRGVGSRAVGHRQMEVAYQDQGLVLLKNTDNSQEVFYASAAAPAPYLARDIKEDDPIDGKILRGVPILSSPNPIVEIAQAAIELAFTFVKITKSPGGSTTYSTRYTNSYYTGVRLVLGLKAPFVTDIHSVVKRTAEGFESVLPEPFGTDSVKNARILLTRMMREVDSVVRFAVAISNVLYQHCTGDKRRAYFGKVSTKWADNGNKPVMWVKSWKVPGMKDVYTEGLAEYTTYLMMFQEVRAKSDKYSDKMYRMALGDPAVQLHIENAIRIRDATERSVCVVGDSGALLKIAWAIYHHGIHNVTVDLVEQTGKLEVLNQYIGRVKGSIVFNFSMVTLLGLSNDKKIGIQQKWKEICNKHLIHLQYVPKDMAVIFKSFYFPPLKGVCYITPAEPHNGSIIALIVDKVELEPETLILEIAWGLNLDMRKRCMEFSSWKSLFCLSRERIWDKTPLRTPFFTGPPLALILESVQEAAEITTQELEIQGDPGELEDMREDSEEERDDDDEQQDDDDYDDPVENSAAAVVTTTEQVLAQGKGKTEVEIKEVSRPEVKIPTGPIDVRNLAKTTAVFQFAAVVPEPKEKGPLVATQPDAPPPASSPVRKERKVKKREKKKEDSTDANDFENLASVQEMEGSADD
jgi:hypothetical protein